MQGVFLFIGAIVVLFALWFGGGGADRPISFQGPYLNRIAEPGTSAEAYGESRTPGTPGFIGNFLGGSNATAVTSSDASVYRGRVTLGRSTSGARTSNVKEEYVQIRMSGQSGSTINLSGWKLVSDVTKISMRIPEGAETLKFGIVNAQSAIILSPGQDVIVTSGTSPVGASFKENLCTGYLEQYQEFIPSLSNACPSPSTEYARVTPNGEDSCRSYLHTVSYCETDTEPPRTISNECKAFVRDTLTYNGCVAAHQNDADFSGSSWRVFFNSKTPLWSDERDIIRLIDADGKVVDVLSY